MEKKYIIQLTQNEILTMLMGLKYLEYHHIGFSQMRADYKKDFERLYNIFYLALHQTDFFNSIDSSTISALNKAEE
jgi:hypothetical protein